MMKLRIGLIGLGAAWDQRYRPALRALSDRFEVRAVCEPVAHRAEMVAREFSSASVDGFRALAEREDVDAILMLSDQWFGPLPILAACDYGKSIYCAGALDLEAAQAREIRKRVDESGIAFVAELPCRFAPATVRLKELIATRIGQPRLLFCHQRVRTCAADSQLHPGGPPSRMHAMAELVDWCRFVVGSEPTSVLGLSHTCGIDPTDRDYEWISLDFSGPAGPGTGPVAQISSGRYIPAQWPEAVTYRPPAALQVACENGIAFIDLPSTLVWFDKAGRQMESLESERPVGEHMLSQFHRSVTSLVRSMAGLEDTYKAIVTVQQARASQVDGQRKKLDF